VIQIEPIILPEYVSTRRFLLYEAAISDYDGSQLILFRSFGEYEGAETIDLIIYAPIYLELLVDLDYLRITKPRDEIAQKLAQSFNSASDRVYAIESAGKRFHFISVNFWIHEHKKPMEGSSLPALCSEDLSKRDAYFTEYVEYWYKVD